MTHNFCFLSALLASVTYLLSLSFTSFIDFQFDCTKENINSPPTSFYWRQKYKKTQFSRRVANTLSENYGTLAKPGQKMGQIFRDKEHWRIMNNNNVAVVNEVMHRGVIWLFRWSVVLLNWFCFCFDFRVGGIVHEYLEI